MHVRVVQDPSVYSVFFFFNDTATTEIYTLSLHDALPIFRAFAVHAKDDGARAFYEHFHFSPSPTDPLHLFLLVRSEEHTSELQSHLNLVCRLLLEKKKLLDYSPSLHEISAALRMLVVYFI